MTARCRRPASKAVEKAAALARKQIGGKPKDFAAWMNAEKPRVYWVSEFSIKSRLQTLFFCAEVNKDAMRQYYGSTKLIPVSIVPVEPARRARKK